MSLQSIDDVVAADEFADFASDVEELVAAVPAIVARVHAKSKAKAADMARSGPPAKSKAKAKAGAAVIAGSGPPAKAVLAGSGPPDTAETATSAVLAGSGPPDTAEAKATAKSADTAGSGPPAKAKAKATAKSAVKAGSGPPAKAKAKATAKSPVPAGSGPPAKAKAKATAKSPVPAGSGPPAKAKAKATAKSAVTAGPGPPAKASAEEMIAVAVEAANSVGDGDAVEAADSVGMGKGDGKGDGMFNDYVRCRSCNRFEHFQKCRLLAKQSAQNWRCSGCHVKTTQLYRQFGKWPTTEFEALDDFVKHNFMASLSGMDGPSAVAKANELLETYRVDEEIYTDGGQFLPLNVWATKGWDPLRIDRYSSAGDKKWHNVAGRVMQCAVVTILLSATIINNIAVIRCKLSSHLSPHHVSANGSL
jgi:hypothetical protein